jgi:hypothetical protein
MRNRAISASLVLGAALMLSAPGLASAAGADAPLTLKQRQQLRFPQPVRVGSLSGETVIEAGTSLRKLGVVIGVFQPNGGGLELVFRYGGVFGLGARTIAPSIDEVSLVGPMVKINDLDKMDLAALPTFMPSGGKFLGPNDVIHMGIDRKY